MGRNRSTNRRLPVGWFYGPRGKKSGARAIYFRGMNAADKKIVVGVTGAANCLKLSERDDPAGHNAAAIVYAEKIVLARERVMEVVPGTVGELCERAREEFLPSIIHEGTREGRARHVDALEKKYGSRRYARNVYEASRDTAGAYLRAMDIQRHIFEGKATRKVSVNREVRTWELVFTWARAPWGLTEYNPCSGLMENEEKARQVLPSDEGIFKLYRHLDPPARFMVAVIRYYGRRKVEQLPLLITDAKDDGIHMRRGKDAQEKPIILKWDPRLRRMWHRLMLWRTTVLRGEKVHTLAAIVNRKGHPYTETGFNSARKRAMKRAGIAGAFTFHDLRKARAQSLTREEAVNVLAHDDPRTTGKVYRPGAIVVDLNAEVNSQKLLRNSQKKSRDGG